MRNLESPTLPRWPFYAADAVLAAIGAGIALESRRPFDGVTGLAVAACFAAGAGLLALPFLREHGAAVRLWEQANLADAAQQLSQVAAMAREVQAATAHWQALQESAARTESSVREAAALTAAEVVRLGEIVSRADQQEKQALRFEADKLRRAEGEMLQVLVHMLDHVHALHAAAARSGQPQLVRQMANFRTACLDTARRVGLAAFEATPGDAYNAQAHQTVDGKEPPAGHVVASTVACGYSFQGHPLRRILVATGAATDLASAESDRDPATTTFSLGMPSPGPAGGAPSITPVPPG